MATAENTYHLEQFVPPRDPATLPPAKRRRYERAAAEIVKTWRRWMRENPGWMRTSPAERRASGHGAVNDAVAGKPPNERTWLAAMAVDSGVMHETCDANMVFDEALRRLKMIDDRMLDDELPAGEGGQVDVWNDVTHNYGFLERAAAAALRGSGPKARTRTATRRPRKAR